MSKLTPGKMSREVLRTNPHIWRSNATDLACTSPVKPRICANAPMSIIIPSTLLQSCFRLGQVTTSSSLPKLFFLAVLLVVVYVLLLSSVCSFLLELLLYCFFVVVLLLIVWLFFMGVVDIVCHRRG